MDDLAEEVGRRLAASPRQNIPISEVEALMVDLRPELAASADLGRRMGEVVRHVVASGVVSATRLNRPYRGELLPTSLRRPAAPRTERGRPALAHPWRPDLAWAAERITSPGHFEQLKILDRWLTAHPDVDEAPTKERSLEIWDDEKLLDKLLRGLLRGRPIEALRVYSVYPPIVIELVSTGRDGLVVENATTWRSLVTAARAHVAAGEPATVGWIAYGVGNQVGSATPGLAAREPHAIWYFGDFDGAGVGFGADADRAAADAAMPPVRPHPWLYRRLLELGRPQARGDTGEWTAAGLSWLGAELAAHAKALGERRLAQEWVTLRVLRQSAVWLVPGRSAANSDGLGADGCMSPDS